VVTLNRPQVMNALNLQLREEIIGLARAMDADPESVLSFSPVPAKKHFVQVLI